MIYAILVIAHLQNHLVQSCTHNYFCLVLCQRLSTHKKIHSHFLVFSHTFEDLKGLPWFWHSDLAPLNIITTYVVSGFKLFTIAAKTHFVPVGCLC